MGKDRSESAKREKKEKKARLSESNGVTKDKSEKQEKKEKKKRSRDSAVADASAEATKENLEPAVDVDGDAVIGDAKESIGKENGKVHIIGPSVPFANPMADEKTMKKVLKGVKRAAKHKTLRRGVKEVVKSLRKSATTASSPPHALVVLAADISPFDVISHIPVLCEDHHVPYVYVPSRAELGAAGSTKRPTSVVMIVPTVPAKKKAEQEADGKDDKEDWSETYGDLAKTMQKAGRDVRI